MKIRRVTQLAGVLLLGTWVWAQEAPRTELSLDYSFARYAPSASYTQGHSLNGGGGQFKVNIGQYFGIMMDLQGYNSNTTTFNIAPNSTFPSGGTGSVSGNLFTYLFGPVIKVRPHSRFHPYFDVLFGGAHTSVYGNAYKTICQPTTSGCSGSGSPNGDAFAMTSGGGIDIPINDRVDLRVGQFDYLYTRFTNQFTDTGQNNFRYLAGLNIKMGLPFVKMPTVGCAAEPTEVLPWAGPVKVSASPTDFNPKHTLTYSFESSGGIAAAQGESATVETASLTPGQYHVRATVTDPKQKKNNTAFCTASFTVKQPSPPQVACSASPATVKPGEPISVTVNGSSPDMSAIDKRSFSASAGAVKEGETQQGTQPGEFTSVATLDTTGVAPGTVNINIGVTDVHGQSATCMASAEVVAPPEVAAVPTAEMVTKCEFDKVNRPARVSNECKASLDGVALRLQQDPNARLVVIGFADTDKAATSKKLDALRAANIRDYLTKGEGGQQIDGSRIEIRKSADRDNGNIAQVYFVPQNATVEAANTEPIDESTLPAKPKRR